VVGLVCSQNSATLVRIPTPLGPIKVNIQYTYLSGDCTSLYRMVQRTCAGYGGRQLSSPQMDIASSILNKYMTLQSLSATTPSATYTPAPGYNLYEEGNFTGGNWIPSPSCQKYYTASEMTNVLSFIPYWVTILTIYLTMRALSDLFLSWIV
jgi:hypothetical protein